MYQAPLPPLLQLGTLLIILGANEVIPEEFETSTEIFARVFDRFHIPRNVISLQVEMVRQGHYGMLRGMRLQGKQLDELNRFLAGATVDFFRLWMDPPWLAVV